MDKLNLCMRDARILKGLSQAQLADKLGKHRQTVYVWEKDPTKISISDASKISKILEIPLENFLLKNSTKCRYSEGETR